MEIRLLRNGDLRGILDFLSSDYLYNAEIIAIIEKVGLEGKHFQLYGVFEGVSSDIIAGVFVSRKDANLYFPNRNEEFLKNGETIFRALKPMFKNLGVENLSVDFSIRTEISDFLEVKGSKNQYLCAYNKWAAEEKKIRRGFLGESVVVIMLREGELVQAADLHFKCFGQGMNAWKYKSLIEKNLIKLYGIYADGKLVCKGEWMCADAKIGYISGLCTDVGYRGRGFCSFLVSHLIEDILNSGSMPVLSYEDEHLRNFYDILGFECMYVRSVLWLKI